MDGTNAPSINMSSCQKRKHTPSSTSVSDHDGLTKNMEQIVESINGLVGVAKQSHQTQQMNILHQRRKELEDTVQALDKSCMELELNMLEETCPRRKKVYQKMLEEKNEEVEQNRNELEQTTQSIHNHQESIVTATTGKATATPVAMPHYVNVDGTMSIDNGNSSSNNSNQHNDNEDDSDN